MTHFPRRSPYVDGDRSLQLLQDITRLRGQILTGHDITATPAFSRISILDLSPTRSCDVEALLALRSQVHMAQAMLQRLRERLIERQQQTAVNLSDQSTSS